MRRAGANVWTMAFASSPDVIRRPALLGSKSPRGLLTGRCGRSQRPRPLLQEGRLTQTPADSIRCSRRGPIQPRPVDSGASARHAACVDHEGRYARRVRAGDVDTFAAATVPPDVRTWISHVMAGGT
jgi:hypothetical protein